MTSLATQATAAADDDDEKSITLHDLGVVRACVCIRCRFVQVIACRPTKMSEREQISQTIFQFLMNVVC